ncbi:uncharacterized protein LOC134248760 [Saccostrea cucullata]|uniref:uncharacterized protein LOC134248760 n=1 Tax=Saccostrea cuccullata TaxID=36930 RepID=UPI002ED460F0
MATAQGQDIICCQFCPNPVEHHCNLCRVDLCLSCIPKHMADKSREHEIVGFTSRKENTVVLSTCPKHKKKQCETYCQDCKVEICIQCLMGFHKKHEFTDITDVIEEYKQRITADTEELERTIAPKYRNINISTVTTEFDKVISAIKEQEDKICKAICERSIQLTDEIIRQKAEAIRKYTKKQSLAEKRVNQVVQKNKETLKGNNAKAILNYQSRNGDFKKGPDLPSFPCPKLLTGIFKKDKIVDIFGFLQNGEDSEKKSGILKIMDVPAVLGTIQSPYGGEFDLWRIQCVGRDKILISGDDGTIKEMDRTGSILKTMPTNDSVTALTINLDQEPVFSLGFWHFNDIYIFTNDEFKVLFGIPDCYPVGLCYTVTGDLLVSMRSIDMTQSRVVRYSGDTEIQKIEFDSQGQSLFSTGVFSVLLLTENGNGDICIADYVGKTVIVVDCSGELQFKYTGNLSKQSSLKEFSPLNIATDVNFQILINDRSMDCVHVIDLCGNFICYIEHSCSGGMSIDTDHNLVIGNDNTGKIQIIKYLE